MLSPPTRAGAAASAVNSALTGAEAGKLAKLAAYTAVGVALFLVAIKVVGYFVTGSVALLGSLLDSVLDVAASSLNLVAIRHAAIPADREHRFGHGKAEAVAGLAQSMLIGGSAAFLAFQAIARLIAPSPVTQSTVGVIILLVAIAATLALVIFQRRVIARTDSLAISADSLHYKGDVIMNGSVILALVLAELFSLPRIDAAIGLGVAAYIAKNAWDIVSRSFDQLMDREFEEPDRERIKEIVKAEPEVRAMHDLRTRRSGFNLFIQLHLELDPNMRLSSAHEIADRVEEKIKAEFPGAEVIIHEDPAGQETPPVFPQRLH
jgi:ferrous-iron efflux pump FieF